MLTWTESQKVVIIRIISYTALAMDDDGRGAALSLIHRITFANNAEELNSIMDFIRVYVSDETLNGLESDLRQKLAEI